jgi:alpha-L-rhamnosidase
MYSNYLSVPTDCPQRDERVGWTADTQVFAPAAAYFADVYSFLAKWMGDMRDSQSQAGCFPWVAPESNAPGYTIGWTDAGVIVPYILWRRYGETAVVDENWEAMERYMAYVKARADIDPQPFGDWLSYEYGKDMKWLSSERVKQQLPRKKFLSYAYRIWIDRMMAEMAKATGRDDQASLYRRREAEDVAAFRSSCLAADGTILPECDGQCSALYALYLDLMPDANAKKAVCKALRENFRAHGDCLQTGFLGTAILLDAVTYGMEDPALAYTLLLQDKNPSWLYSVDQGATTAWERWNSYTKEHGFGPASMNSFNHYAYGAVASWMVSAMAGIRDDPASPGFKRFVLAPVPDARIGSVSAAFVSPYGEIRSAWRYEGDGSWVWTFAVPANSSALVTLPGQSEAREYLPGTYTLTVRR